MRFTLGRRVHQAAAGIHAPTMNASLVLPRHVSAARIKLVASVKSQLSHKASPVLTNHSMHGSAHDWCVLCHMQAMPHATMDTVERSACGILQVAACCCPQPLPHVQACDA